jgi:MFS family permease
MAQDSSPRLPLRFWIAALVAFINAVGFTLIIPLIYPYAKQFGLSDFHASLLTTAYAAAQFVGTPILGRLSDRLGRKPLLLMLSLLGTVAANLMAGLATVAWLLYMPPEFWMALREGNTSIARAIISDITTEEQRPESLWHFWRTLSSGLCGRASPELSGPVDPHPAGVFELWGWGFCFRR